MAKKYVIGIDEVGRGPLAGPVTVAAVAVPRNLQLTTNNLPLRDSKKLSARQREAWFRYLKTNPHVAFAISHVTPKVIDRINITRAANRAATKALLRLISNSQYLMSNTRILLDGGLFIRVNPRRYPRVSARTVVRGDERYRAIKLASIVAKVRRDRYMRRKHREFPQYGFDRHKGYGTKAHYRALRKHGPCPLHRKTFI